MQPALLERTLLDFKDELIESFYTQKTFRKQTAQNQVCADELATYKNFSCL